MNWLDDLTKQEQALQERLAELAERAQTLPARGELDQTVRPAIEAMQATLDDYLCGRDMEERFRMSFEVRLRLPLFSHLRSLLGLVSAAGRSPPCGAQPAA